MEDVLIMNKLPCPRYYDGNLWNTVLEPNRKSVPKYLRGDLPKLNMLILKQEFKKANKLVCPKLDYFEKIIKERKALEKKKIKKTPSKNKSSETTKEELQYALITCDKNSSVIDELVEKLHHSTFSVMKPNEENKKNTFFFEGTMDLVFRQRKNAFLAKIKKPKIIPSSISAIEEIEKIALLPINC